ncbi:MAG: hypothetical protein LPK85_07065 [Gammaproteobacteria bacterium]|nr:hypothetical protein [Gammaproteobacteria bacterium]
MSQLSRLIEQARKTRRVNDMFKVDSASFLSQDAGTEPPPMAHEAHEDAWPACVADLENLLFENPPSAPLALDELVAELELIARTL